MNDLKISVVQDELDWQDAAANRERYTRHIDSFLSDETDLIVLPEMFSTGFCMQPEGIAETMEGPTVHWMRGQAERSGAVVTGSIILEEGGVYKNRMIWARPDGFMAYYDKRHLFRYGDEHIHYTAGNERVVVELDGWRLALFVCYDLRFPVWSRNRNDYDVALYVANWPAPRQYAWDTLLRARAIENQVYVVGVNRIGSDGIGNDFTGGTAVLDCLGKPMADCGDRLMNATVALSREAQETFRQHFPAGMDSDSFTIDASPGRVRGGGGGDLWNSTQPDASSNDGDP